MPLLDTAARLEAVLGEPAPPPPGGLSRGRAQLLASLAERKDSQAHADTDGRRREPPCRPAAGLLSLIIAALAIPLALGRGYTAAAHRRRQNRRRD